MTCKDSCEKQGAEQHSAPCLFHIAPNRMADSESAKRPLKSTSPRSVNRCPRSRSTDFGDIGFGVIPALSSLPLFLLSPHKNFLKDLEGWEKVHIFAAQESMAMKTNANIPPANRYWGMVKHLKRETKIDLIVMLTESLKEEAATPEVHAHDFYGSWGDDGMSAEDFVKEIKDARKFKEEIIEM